MFILGTLLIFLALAIAGICLIPAVGLRLGIYTDTDE